MVLPGALHRVLPPAEMAPPPRRQGIAARRVDLPGRPPPCAARPPDRPRPGMDPDRRPTPERTASRHRPDPRPDRHGAVWGFVITMVLLGVRVATGWSLIDLAPVGVLAAIALPAALGTTRPAVDGAETRRRARSSTTAATRSSTSSAPTSIVRVIIWHALGFWWISWTFAAMPAVFYVVGCGLGDEPADASCWTVVKARLRRLIPPYLAFICIGLGRGAVRLAGACSTTPPAQRRSRGSSRIARPPRSAGRTAGCRPRCGSCGRSCWCCSSRRSCDRSASGCPVAHVRRLDRLVVRRSTCG